MLERQLAATLSCTTGAAEFRRMVPGRQSATRAHGRNTVQRRPAFSSMAVSSHDGIRKKLAATYEGYGITTAYVGESLLAARSQPYNRADQSERRGRGWCVVRKILRRCAVKLVFASGENEIDGDQDPLTSLTVE